MRARRRMIRRQPQLADIGNQALRREFPETRHAYNRAHRRWAGADPSCGGYSFGAVPRRALFLPCRTARSRAVRRLEDFVLSGLLRQVLKRPAIDIEMTVGLAIDLYERMDQGALSFSQAKAKSGLLNVLVARVIH